MTPPRHEQTKRKIQHSTDNVSKRSRTNDLNSNNEDSINEVPTLSDTDSLSNQLTSILQNKINNGNRIEALQQCNDLIEYLNVMLQDTIKHRMDAYSEVHNITKQLEDAETMMQERPQDPCGYITAANAYSMRGFQQQVLAVVKNGLRHTSFMEPGYETLESQYSNANERLSRRVNFFVKLPCEVAYRVADHIPFQDLSECLKVSKSWRYRLLDYSNIWHKCTISEFCIGKDGPTHLYLQQLPHVSRFITDFYLDYLPQPIFDKCMNFVENGNFSKLKHISIKTSNVYMFPSSHSNNWGKIN